MPKIRVHELASKLGRSNREVIEFLKANGVEVKSHMSTLEEPSIRLIKQKFLTRGKEQITKVDNSRTEEKTVTARPEADKAEAPKKKKNIIRVYHAQNASDGGKNRPKRQNNNTDKRPAAKPQAQKPQAAQKPVEETAKKPQTAQAEAPKSAAPAQNNSARPQRQEQSGYNNNRGQNRQNNRDGRDNNRDNRGGEGRGRDFRGGERRFSDRNGNGGQGRPNRDGNRQGRPQGEGRPARQGDGNGRPMRGQGGRPQQGGQGRPQQGGNGRPDGNRGGFGGNNRGGQRSGGGRRDNDAVFTPELTKTSKDSKRERDRENKNKKKDFEKSGADDYLTKPFLMQELLLRVQHILLRTYRAELARTKSKDLKLADRSVDLNDALVTLSNGDTIPLTATELALLRKLADNRGHIVTYDSLCSAVWDADYYGYENSLGVHIRHLRQKLEQDPNQPRCLLTVRGIGYKLAKEELL